MFKKLFLVLTLVLAFTVGNVMAAEECTLPEGAILQIFGMPGQQFQAPEDVTVIKLTNEEAITLGIPPLDERFEMAMDPFQNIIATMKGTLKDCKPIVAQPE